MVEIERKTLEAANSNSPICSMATKKKNQVAKDTNNWIVVQTETEKIFLTRCGS